MAGLRVLTRRMSARSRRLVQLLLSVVLVGAMFLFVFKRIDVASVRSEIARMTWIESGTILAVAAWNLMTYLWLWMLVTPGLGVGRSLIVTQSGTAVTNVWTVPADGSGEPRLLVPGAASPVVVREPRR